MITASPTVYQVHIGYNKSYIVRLSNAIPIWESQDISLGSIDITCTCIYLDDYSILYAHTVTALQEAREDPSSFYKMVT